MAEGAVEIAHSLVGDGEVALVVGAIRFGLRQLFSDGEGLEKGEAGGFALAEVAVEIAHVVIGDGEVALVVGAIRFRGCAFLMVLEN